jgi:hypothetical protein
METANRSTQAGPIDRLVTYRPKRGHEDALAAILRSHGPALRKCGLLTDEPIRIWRAIDLRGDGEPGAYFVETFQWRDQKASDLAHQLPEIMAVWETMGQHLAGMTLTTLEAL